MPPKRLQHGDSSKNTATGDVVELGGDQKESESVRIFCMSRRRFNHLHRKHQHKYLFEFQYPYQLKILNSYQLRNPSYRSCLQLRWPQLQKSQLQKML